MKKYELDEVAEILIEDVEFIDKFLGKTIRTSGVDWAWTRIKGFIEKSLKNEISTPDGRN